MVAVAFESTDHARTVVPIERFPCVVGRHRDCDVRLPSWRVARCHAEIRLEGRFLSIADRGSLGGTWVNGERVSEFGPLSVEDDILIAGFSLRVLDLPELALGDGPAWTADTRAHPVLAATSAVDAASSPPTDPDRRIEWRRHLHRALLSEMDLRRQEIRHLESEELKRQVRTRLQAIAAAMPEVAQRPDLNELLDAVMHEAIGLGVLEPLLAANDITEIMVNGCEPVFIERAGRLEQTGLRFSSEDAIRSVIERIVGPIGRRIDDASPMVDARLPDGSRVNAVIRPLSVRGSSITIRRFNARLFTPADLVRLGSASEAMMKFLQFCVGERRNIVVSGGTGSGKTSLLNLLSRAIGLDERLVTIEDAAELRLEHPNLVSLEVRPANSEGQGAITIRDLVRNALRMRPDRILVGECRGGEALDMLQAMNTGHDGSLTTVHANSARDALARLEIMVLMAGVDLPVAAIREQLASALDLIVQQARGRDGVRRIVEIAEVVGVEAGRIQTQPLFRHESADGVGRYRCCGNVPGFLDELGLQSNHWVRRLFSGPGGPPHTED